MKLYALHDKKAQVLNAFSVQHSDVIAGRGFTEAVLQPNSQLAKYPEDFELVSLCDVSQDYRDLALMTLNVSEGGFLGDFEFRVVLTASQVLLSQPKPDAQIPMRLEA